MKSSTPDKKAILKAIVTAAQAYDKELVGKTFLYVFEGKHIEVTYRVRDFKHLTGVDTSSPASSFYKDALHNKLQLGQFTFSSRHPYDLCVRKMCHLPKLPMVTRSDLIVLEKTTTSTKTYEFGFTELNFTLCLDKDLDSNGHPKTDCYVPESLRDEDSFSRSGAQYECNYIFSKQNQSKYYDTLCFSDGKTKIIDLPEDVRQKLSPCLLGVGQNEDLSAYQI